MTTRVARASLSALLLFLAIGTPATAVGPDPTSAYVEGSVQGFTVLVNRGVLEHKNEAAEAIKEVNAQYFADLTEAYFGKNDFFPFNREDLKKYDPTGYQLMKTVWGQPRNGAAPSGKR